MKSLRLCFVLFVSFVVNLSFTGCTSTLQKLPPINADSFIYERHDPMGGSVVTAKKVTLAGDGSVSADEAEWNTTYPQFGVHVKVIGYKQSAPLAKP